MKELCIKQLALINHQADKLSKKQKQNFRSILFSFYGSKMFQRSSTSNRKNVFFFSFCVDKSFCSFFEMWVSSFFFFFFVYSRCGRRVRTKVNCMATANAKVRHKLAIRFNRSANFYNGKVVVMKIMSKVRYGSKSLRIGFVLVLVLVCYCLRGKCNNAIAKEIH